MLDPCQKATEKKKKTKRGPGARGRVVAGLSLNGSSQLGVLGTAPTFGAMFRGSQESRAELVTAGGG